VNRPQGRGPAIATNEITLAGAIEPPAAVASVRQRTGGYIIDMVIFAALAMVMIVVAGLVLLLATDWAQKDASDAVAYGFLAIIGLGTPLAWSLMNLLLLFTRRQTGGQYVAGLRVAREDAQPLRPATAVAWWFLLNPLLFSWPMALIAGLPLAGAISLLLNNVTVVAFGVVVTLCVVAPLIALISALADGQNRALQDRIAGTVVVPAS
jgi:uncharacterized RDD family membrane protein YckC